MCHISISRVAAGRLCVTLGALRVSSARSESAGGETNAGLEESDPRDHKRAMALPRIRALAGSRSMVEEVDTVIGGGSTSAADRAAPGALSRAVQFYKFLG